MTAPKTLTLTLLLAITLPLAAPRKASACAICHAYLASLVDDKPAAKNPGSAKPKSPHAHGPSKSAPKRKKISPFISNIRQLTFAGKRTGEGYFNEDTTRMIFQSEREPDNPFYQIYTFDLKTGKTKRISPGHGKTTCAWFHPNGNTYLFASTHADPDARKKQAAEFKQRKSGTKKRYAWDYDHHYDIYAATEDRNGKLTYKNLTNVKGYDAEGSYSPNGKLVAFASNRHAYTEKLSKDDAKRFALNASHMMDIYIMNSDGSNVKRLTKSPGYDGGPFFSPDGKRICWRRFSPDGHTAEIFTMNIDGSDQKQLTQLNAMSWAPYYHPSGKYLIFSTNIHGYSNFELYIVDAQGKQKPIRVTNASGFDGLPTFQHKQKIVNFGRGPADWAHTTISWTSNRTWNKKSQVYIGRWDHHRAMLLLKQKGKTESFIGASPHGPSSLIDEKDIKTHITKLASDEFEGRGTGTKGARLATQYVADQFKKLGLQPAGDNGTYFQEFKFTGGITTGKKNKLILSQSKKSKKLLIDRDWRPVSFSKAGDIKPMPIVFAGYGISAPAGDGYEEYDSYVHLDVKDKWVLVIRAAPKKVKGAQASALQRRAPLVEKAKRARKAGAAGIIFISGPNKATRTNLVPLRNVGRLSGDPFPAISLSTKAATAIFKAAGKDLKKLHDKLDTGAQIMGFPLKEITLHASIDLKRVQHTGRNVLAKLPANTAGPAKSAIAIGGHVDHLGHGHHGGSRARKDELGKVHPGADDNASGIAAMLEIAQSLAAKKAAGKLPMKHDILFTAWSGEEMGLIGSSHFVRQYGTGKNSKLRPAFAAYLNMDMIGRYRPEKRLTVHGIASSSAFAKLIEQANAPIKLAIAPNSDNYLPSDSTSFYTRGVPFVAAFTGVHADYHTPRDTVDTVNFHGTTKVAKFMARIAEQLANFEGLPDYIATKRNATARRGPIRVFLGTIPDYAQEGIKGLRLSGVSKGGPAEKAGLVADDVVIKLAGIKIQNIYHYTNAITKLKVGKPTKIIVLRDGKKITLTITPASRN